MTFFLTSYGSCQFHQLTRVTGHQVRPAFCEICAQLEVICAPIRSHNAAIGYMRKHSLVHLMGGIGRFS